MESRQMYTYTGMGNRDAVKIAIYIGIDVWIEGI